MMYSFGWLSLVVISLAVSLIAFMWGLDTGQFSDQARARYLPLRDQLPKGPAGTPAELGRSVYVLLGIIACGLLTFMMPILLTFLHS